MNIKVRNTQVRDFPGIVQICKDVYPDSPPWAENQLKSHLQVFPEGQFVAIDEDTNRVVGMSASLIINWEDYDFQDSWKDFTDGGLFTNHDPVHGRTLYAAEIMVSPDTQGSGVGSLLYEAREELVKKNKLLRIRAGARLRGYGAYAKQYSPDDYVIQVVQGKIFDPTLSFQLNRGFRVLQVVSGYLKFDSESLGYAAVIEWLNKEVADPAHYLKGNPKFRVSGTGTKES